MPPEEMMSTLDRLERDALNSALRFLLSNDAGKRVLYWMLEQTAIYRDAYTGDPASTNYTLGQQSTGRKLIAKIDEIDARFYPQLLLDIAEIRSRDSAAADNMNQPEDDDDAP